MSKSDKKEIHFEREMRTAEVINYLELVIKSLKEGKIVIEHGDVAISLTPAEVIEVEIEAKQKKRKAKLSLEISWALANM
jgi:amphi-Trp domain-containing protein